MTEPNSSMAEPDSTGSPPAKRLKTGSDKETAIPIDPITPISQIAPDGDIILEVGPYKEQLRVYPECLRTSSKVFNSMLGHGWKESKPLSSPSKIGIPRVIPLAEDDASALRTVFCFLHHRNEEVPEPDTLTPVEILDIAVMSDKYDLAVALKYISPQWLKPRDGPDLMGMGRLATAALLMEDAPMFAVHCMGLMLNWGGDYQQLLEDKTIAQFLPFKAVYLLEKRRTQMRAEIYDLIAENCNIPSKCEHGNDDCYRMNELKGSYSRWRTAKLHVQYLPSKLLNHKLADIFHALLRKISSEECLKKKSKCNGNPWGQYQDKTHDALPSDELVAGRLLKIRKRAEICLDCVRGANQCKTHEV